MLLFHQVECGRNQSALLDVREKRAINNEQEVKLKE